MEVSSGVAGGGMEFGNTLGLTQGGGTDFSLLVSVGQLGRVVKENLPWVIWTASCPSFPWDSLQEVEGPQAHRWHCHLHHLFDLLGN